MWRDRDQSRERRSLECPDEPSVKDLVSAVSLAHMVAWDYVSNNMKELSDEEVETLYSDIQDAADRLGELAARLARHLTAGARVYRALERK